jgi:hexokinase
MESDPTEELLMIIGIFTHFFALETTLAERQFFRALAKLVGRRAARLSSCGIAAIVTKMGYLDAGCSVGADGSLYNVRPVSLDRLLSPGREREHSELMVTATVSRRNTLASRNVCMRACRTSLARKAGESPYTAPLIFPEQLFFHFFSHFSP